MILIIHPYDRSTSFLDRISNMLKKSYPDIVFVLCVYPNDASRQYCYKRIRECSSDDLIVFLGHGRSDALYGSKGDLYDKQDFVSDIVIQDSPSKFYYNEHLISCENFDLLHNKKMVLISCESNSLCKKISSRVSLGFGKIPLSVGELQEKWCSNPSGKLVALIKGEFCYIVKYCLAYAIKYEYSFDQLHDIFIFVLQQRIACLIRENGSRHKFMAARILYDIKQSLVVCGDSSSKLL